MFQMTGYFGCFGILEIIGVSVSCVVFNVSM